MSVHLHIDHLVLDGLPVEHGDARLVQAAVEAALTRLLASGSIAPDLYTGGGRPSVPSEDIYLTDNDTPTTLGRKIGGAVHGGIGR